MLRQKAQSSVCRNAVTIWQHRTCTSIFKCIDKCSVFNRDVLLHIVQVKRELVIEVELKEVSNVNK